jgi:hypothetical protein
VNHRSKTLGGNVAAGRFGYVETTKFLMIKTLLLCTLLVHQFAPFMVVFSAYGES